MRACVFLWNASVKVTGALVLHLRKVCRCLKELDLADCKSVDSASVRRVFESCPALQTLNVSFLDAFADEAFEVTIGARGLSGTDKSSSCRDLGEGLILLSLSWLCCFASQ